MHLQQSADLASCVLEMMMGEWYADCRAASLPVPLASIRWRPFSRLKSGRASRRGTDFGGKPTVCGETRHIPRNYPTPPVASKHLALPSQCVVRSQQHAGPQFSMGKDSPLASSRPALQLRPARRDSRDLAGHVRTWQDSGRTWHLAAGEIDIRHAHTPRASLLRHSTGRSSKVHPSPDERGDPPGCSLLMLQ